jgi:hypothetical protein
VAGELFELELLGGNTERRYRKLRPEVELMPWGTLDLGGASAEDVLAARLAWTSAAYQEHRTAVACALTLRLLIEARAPLDLVAIAARFPLDELVHVELCARMAMELGGGTEIIHDPELLVNDPEPEGTPLLRAAECAVRFFCVGEALSIPLLRATWHSTRHPLPRAVLGRIVKDEAAHGVFGFTFLDWALPNLSEGERSDLGRAADRAIRYIYRLWGSLEGSNRRPNHGDYLGWMGTTEYLTLARRAMQSDVISALERRGIPISAQLPPLSE